MDGPDFPGRPFSEPTMRIATRNPHRGRTHRVAGKDYTFDSEDGRAPFHCDVTDEAAIAVFLCDYNANLFYALDEPAPLTRAAPVPPADPPPPVAVDLPRLLAGSAPSVIDALGDFPADTLRGIALLEAEGKNRKTVIEAVDARLAELAA